jgi:single-strand DNA-binding protein
VANFNRIIMIGNLTKDPDYKQQPSGTAVCKLSIASNRQFRNKQTGAMTQEVCYIDVDVWGAQADNCRQYLQKGRPVLVEGRLKFDTWESEGQVKRRHSIVADRVIFLGSNQANEQADDYIASVPENKRKESKETDDSSFGQLAGEALFKDEVPFEDDLPF